MEILKTQERNVVIVGENGSGKSFLLNRIARHYAAQGGHVVAIANTIFDKFDRRGSNYEFIGARQGRSLPERTIKRALMGSIEKGLINLKRISRVLEYIGYSASLGFSIRGFVGYEAAKRILELDPIRSDSHQGNGWFDYFFPDFTVFGVNIEKATWIHLDHESFTGIPGQLLQLLNMEDSLRRAGVLKKIEVFLIKDGMEIPVAKASSGEISLLCCWLFISTKVEKGTYILIDEPENSLHPAWQRDYFSRLLDLFDYYDLRITVATHSPLIVTAAAETMKSLSIYRSEMSEVGLLDYKSGNLEELLFDIFGVSTPANRHLSNTVKNLLNRLAQKEVGLEFVQQRINELKELSFKDDVEQREMLEGIRDLAIKMSERM
ncbi:MAG: AAA family ATPase [Gammaproteobacteria bacterium]|nr:AAA family ATPase [Gammaproteobacteria bacterium]